MDQDRSRGPSPPRWLKPVNTVFVLLQRLGVRLGGMHVLTVPGRRSGRPRATPVSVFTVDGRRYIVGGFPDADWVRNLRASGGRASLASGRRRGAVRLVELPADAARPILSVFPVKVPSAIDMMAGAGLVQRGTPDEFAALAGRCPVFRIDAV